MKQPDVGPRSTRVLILGGDADGNLGDRAILDAMCAEACANAELTIVSRRARVDGARVVRKGLLGLPALCRAAARSDLVLCGGGGLFQDDDSLVKMPYWALRLALVRLFCPRVVGYSLGVGPLKAASSRFFARLAFGCMHRVSVRDTIARDAAQPLTRHPVEVVPDPALLLEPAPEEEARRWLRAHGVPLDRRPLLGVAPRRWFPPQRRLMPNMLRPRQPGPDNDRLIDKLAATLTRTGAFCVFLPTYNVAHEGDDRVSEKILAKMPAGAIGRIDDPALYKAVAGQLTAMLGGRMHPTILAASMGTPIVGLAYNTKFRGFFDLLGRRRFVLDVAAFLEGGGLSGMLATALSEGRLDGARVAAMSARTREFMQEVVR